MDNLFRRRRLLKTLLSLTLVFGTLVTIQKFKVADSGVKELRWKPRDKSWKSAPNANASSSWDGEVSAVTRRPLATWSVEAANCSVGTPRALGKEWLRKLEPRFQQFVLHRHCRYFPMLLNHPEKCGADVDVLLVVKSVIEEHERREAVRKTWGAERTVRGKRVKTLFLLGSPATGKDTNNLQKLLEYEDRIYGDILQWDFMDTFFNLTLKEVNFLRWFHIYCAHVPFVFKGDDDVFVNTENLVDLIGFRTEEGRAHELFVGDTISKAIPIRNKQSKYYIPKEMFDKPYPPYVGGGGFLMSASVARRLFVASERLELFPIDDVFLGMCLQRLGKAPESHPGFKTFGIVKRRVSSMNSEPCFYRQLIVVHKLSARDLLKMWSVVQDHKLTCAKKYSL
ncbi:UDP-GlcNAc:betaGal beta-1,3-N-acetylglucosaminyltransferase 7, like [Colossoma macropomum]|uniref:UDP-GlcNAc:betaGal beta-1,3-N-acetylglucosaminyltransferase 7, like n=1 Tax=Colossoma macropomum TaxID=42526 RepID=UPI001863FD1E|nr:UDP-GlcNAc:betaGal beta-1,3-N-acetylglucosaminyltransferase 7, like [Colossoma macropomum]